MQLVLQQRKNLPQRQKLEEERGVYFVDRQQEIILKLTIKHTLET